MTAPEAADPIGSSIASDGRRSFSGRGMAVSMVSTLILDIGVAILAFNVAKHGGAGDQVAYLASGVGPLTMMLITWVRARTLSGGSAVILVFLLLSAAAAFIGGADSRLVIVKDSAVTAGFGLACLASPLLLPKPLMFYFGAKFATDGTREGLSYWYSLWRYPQFRKSQDLINVVWGGGFLIEAGLRIAIAYSVADFQTAYTITSILPFVFLAGLISYTVALGERARTAALARRKADAAPAER